MLRKNQFGRSSKEAGKLHQEPGSAVAVALVK